MKYLTLAIVAGLAALTGCAAETYHEDEAQSESADAAMAPGECAAGQGTKAFDICEYTRGTQWAPKCYGPGTHILTGKAPDNDISSLKVAANYRVKLYDAADGRTPFATVTNNTDLCSTVNNDKASKLVVERISSPDPDTSSPDPGTSSPGGFAPEGASCRLVLNEGFDRHTGAMTPYRLADMQRDFGNTSGPYKGLDDGRTKVGNSMVQAFFPEGALLGNETGFSWFNELPGGVEEAIMEYRMKFSAGYDWTRGGKLPGLCGGTCPRGCTDDTSRGFSMRNMWRKDGGMVTYAYWPEKPDSQRCGADWHWSDDVESNRWYTVRQHIKLNTPGQRNGLIEAYLDGKLVQRKTDVKFRLSSNVTISKAYITTYVGGTTDAFRPSRDQFIWFDSFKVWTGCSR